MTECMTSAGFNWFAIFKQNSKLIKLPVVVWALTIEGVQGLVPVPGHTRLYEAGEIPGFVHYQGPAKPVQAEAEEVVLG